MSQFCMRLFYKMPQQYYLELILYLYLCTFLAKKLGVLFLDCFNTAEHAQCV